MSMSHHNFPSLRQLRAFEAVARLQSMSGAAREINLSQPGVTQSVEALERQLKGKLLQRRRSGCYPTKLGAILLPRVQCFFDHVRSALDELIVSNPAMSRQTLDMTHKITKPQQRASSNSLSPRFIDLPRTSNASCAVVSITEQQKA